MLVNSWFSFVGVAGFEPTTPCSQSRCANRTALHPVQNFSFVKHTKIIADNVSVISVKRVQRYSLFWIIQPIIEIIYFLNSNRYYIRVKYIHSLSCIIRFCYRHSVQLKIKIKQLNTRYIENKCIYSGAGMIRTHDIPISNEMHLV